MNKEKQRETLLQAYEQYVHIFSKRFPNANKDWVLFIAGGSNWKSWGKQYKRRGY